MKNLISHLLICSFFSLFALVTVSYAAHTAKDITERYYYTPDDCGGPNRPAFLCSGVLLRATRYSPKFHSWNPSPQAQTDGGISFLFLRKDAKFSKLPLHYTNGTIFYPELGTTRPKSKRSIEYLCAYPVDGYTDDRYDNGCGMKKNKDSRTRPCELQNIYTGSDWVKRFGHDQSFAHEACGFTVAYKRNVKGGTAKSFMASLKAAQLLGKKAFYDWNEIVAKTWQQNQGKTLPIEAFFYLKKEGQIAREAARSDQIDLFRTEGVWVPVIVLTLPQDTNDDATFHYHPDDQAINPQ